MEHHPLSAENREFMELPDRWRAKTGLPWEVRVLTPVLGACGEKGTELVESFAADDELRMRSVWLGRRYWRIWL